MRLTDASDGCVRQDACGMCGDPMQVLPQEVCDENDNDCDGQVDEGVKNKCGTCGDEPAEVCDGADNDCDQRTDEGDDICAVGERCECARCVKPCPGGLNECPGGALCVEGFCLPPECVDGNDRPSSGMTDMGVTTGTRSPMSTIDGGMTGSSPVTSDCGCSFEQGQSHHRLMWLIPIMWFGLTRRRRVMRR